MTSENETSLQWNVTTTEPIAAEVTDSQCRGGALSNAAGHCRDNHHVTSHSQADR